MVLVTSKTETLIEEGEKRKRWMNARLQSAAAAAALEGNNQPGTPAAEACMYRALCGLAGLHQTTVQRQTEREIRCCGFHCSFFSFFFFYCFCLTKK